MLRRGAFAYKDTSEAATSFHGEREVQRSRAPLRLARYRNRVGMAVIRRAWRRGAAGHSAPRGAERQEEQARRECGRPPIRRQVSTWDEDKQRNRERDEQLGRWCVRQLIRWSDARSGGSNSGAESNR